MRVTINMNEDLLKRVDECAEQLSLSRSSYIALACSEKMKVDDAMALMPKLLAQMEAMKQNGEGADKL